MTDIHKLHTDLTEEYKQEWLTADGKYWAKWKEPFPMFPQIMERIETDECLFYHANCSLCAQIIHAFSMRNQHTIESLEKRISELERELNENEKN